MQNMPNRCFNGGKILTYGRLAVYEPSIKRHTLNVVGQQDGSWLGFVIWDFKAWVSFISGPRDLSSDTNLKVQKEFIWIA